MERRKGKWQAEYQRIWIKNIKITLNDIVRGRREISADTALRLAHYFRMTARFWLNAQVAYNLSKAETEGLTFAKAASRGWELRVPHMIFDELPPASVECQPETVDQGILGRNVR